MWKFFLISPGEDKKSSVFFETLCSHSTTVSVTLCTTCIFLLHDLSVSGGFTTLAERFMVSSTHGDWRQQMGYRENWLASACNAKYGDCCLAPNEHVCDGSEASSLSLATLFIQPVNLNDWDAAGIPRISWSGFITSPSTDRRYQFKRAEDGSWLRSSVSKAFRCHGRQPTNQSMMSHLKYSLNIDCLTVLLSPPCDTLKSV